MKSSAENSPSEPKLQPPGAGLPLVQRIILKAWLGPFVSKRVPPAETRAGYELLVKKIIHAAAKVPSPLRLKKILIKPALGMEDSSRYWSVNETLEHLLIVNRAMESTILSLASGVIPNGVVDTAKVKPGHADHDLLEEFSATMPNLVAEIDAKLNAPGMDFESPAALLHPWFGPFRARQWYWLLAGHQGIHYRQIKEISANLK